MCSCCPTTYIIPKPMNPHILAAKEIDELCSSAWALLRPQEIEWRGCKISIVPTSQTEGNLSASFDNTILFPYTANTIRDCIRALLREWYDIVDNSHIPVHR